VETEHTTVDEYGTDYAVVLRLNVHCQSPVPEGWTLALKLHKIRIDGVDWEPKFDATDETQQSGWHRHQWNQKQQSCKDYKVLAPDLDGIGAREQFLIRSFSLMRIRVSKTDYGDQLSFTQSDFA
jgi:hypothetical protein